MRLPETPERRPSLEVKEDCLLNDNHRHSLLKGKFAFPINSTGTTYNYISCVTDTVGKMFLKLSDKPKASSENTSKKEKEFRSMTTFQTKLEIVCRCVCRTLQKNMCMQFN